MGEGGEEERNLKHRSRQRWGRSQARVGNSLLPPSPLPTELPADPVLSLNSSHSVFNP